jgi:mannose-6-phosphate isomerase-like protein (cupin superfamily)
MASIASYTRYTFRERSGYILDPSDAGAAQKLIAIGHTALVTPWADPELHLHQESEEYYFLLQGELWISVAGSQVSVRPQEVLMVRPGVPHAIVRGEGLIEHLGIRAPAANDKQPVGEITSELASMQEDEREVRCDWGCRVPLSAAANCNCWLFGAGTARFQSAHLTMAFLDFPTDEQANAGIGTRHRLHLHQQSWEYYGVLQGTKTLQIEDELVEIKAGEILEVPPQTWHTLYGRQAPYVGFTLRVPVGWGDKVEK